MIVADTNLIAYLLLPGSNTPSARGVFLRDPAWAVPLLWRSEFRNVLVGYLRRRELSQDDALILYEKAEEHLAGREHLVPAEAVFRLAVTSGCSAYDCEFVALAERLGVSLVTSDRRILRCFPGRALTPARFLAAGSTA